MDTNKELERLLRQNMSEKFNLPDELDRKTKMRMYKIKENRSSHFIRMLIILNLLLAGFVFLIIWQFNTDFTLKLILSAIFFSLVTLLLTLYIINYQLNHKKEIIL